MVIAFGGDHTALELKRMLMDVAEELGHDTVDCGAYDSESVDYPDVAFSTCDKILKGRADRAVLICGTGLGMSIAANKVNGIRCAHCTETFSAALARQHNDSNVLALGARTVGPELNKQILITWLKTGFDGGRHSIRVGKITEYENRAK